MTYAGDPYPLVRSPWGAPGPRPVTARPEAPELTAAELRFLDRPDEPESLRERVAIALSWADGGDDTGEYWRIVSNDLRDAYRHLADAALAVVRGEQ